MQSHLDPELVGAISSWLAERENQVEVIRKLEVRDRTAASDIAKAEEGISKISRHAADATVAAYLQGDEPAPPTAADRKRLRALRDLREGAQGARPQILAELDSARAALAEIDQRTEPALDLAGAMISVSRNSIRAALADLTPAIVDLLAVDAVRSHLIGDQFLTRAPDHPGLASGTRIVAEFLNRIPAALRPIELEAARIEMAVRERTNSILTLFAGGHS